MGLYELRAAVISLSKNKQLLNICHLQPYKSDRFGGF